MAYEGTEELSMAQRQFLQTLLARTEAQGAAHTHTHAHAHEPAYASAGAHSSALLKPAGTPVGVSSGPHAAGARVDGLRTGGPAPGPGPLLPLPPGLNGSGGTRASRPPISHAPAHVHAPGPAYPHGEVNVPAGGVTIGRKQAPPPGFTSADAVHRRGVGSPTESPPPIVGDAAAGREVLAFALGRTLAQTQTQTQMQTQTHASAQPAGAKVASPPLAASPAPSSSLSDGRASGVVSPALLSGTATPLRGLVTVRTHSRIVSTQASSETDETSGRTSPRLDAHADDGLDGVVVPAAVRSVRVPAMPDAASFAHARAGAIESADARPRPGAPAAMHATQLRGVADAPQLRGVLQYAHEPAVEHAAPQGVQSAAPQAATAVPPPVAHGPAQLAAGCTEQTSAHATSSVGGSMQSPESLPSHVGSRPYLSSANTIPARAKSDAVAHGAEPARDGEGRGATPGQAIPGMPSRTLSASAVAQATAYNAPVMVMPGAIGGAPQVLPLRVVPLPPHMQQPSPALLTSAAAAPLAYTAYPQQVIPPGLRASFAQPSAHVQAAIATLPGFSQAAEYAAALAAAGYPAAASPAPAPAPYQPRGGIATATETTHSSLPAVAGGEGSAPHSHDVLKPAHQAAGVSVPTTRKSAEPTRRLARVLGAQGQHVTPGETTEVEVILSRTQLSPRQPICVYLSGPTPKSAEFVCLFRVNSVDNSRPLVAKPVRVVARFDHEHSDASNAEAAERKGREPLRMAQFVAPRQAGTYDFRVLSSDAAEATVRGRSVPFHVSFQANEAADAVHRAHDSLLTALEDAGLIGSGCSDESRARPAALSDKRDSYRTGAGGDAGRGRPAHSVAIADDVYGAVPPYTGIAKTLQHLAHSDVELAAGRRPAPASRHASMHSPTVSSNVLRRIWQAARALRETILSIHSIVLHPPRTRMFASAESASHPIQSAADIARVEESFAAFRADPDMMHALWCAVRDARYAAVLCAWASEQQIRKMLGMPAIRSYDAVNPGSKMPDDATLGPQRFGAVLSTCSAAASILSAADAATSDSLDSVPVIASTCRAVAALAESASDALHAAVDIVQALEMLHGDVRHLLVAITSATDGALTRALSPAKLDLIRTWSTAANPITDLLLPLEWELRGLGNPVDAAPTLRSRHDLQTLLATERVGRHVGVPKVAATALLLTISAHALQTHALRIASDVGEESASDGTGDRAAARRPMLPSWDSIVCLLAGDDSWCTSTALDERLAARATTTRLSRAGERLRHTACEKVQTALTTLLDSKADADAVAGNGEEDAREIARVVVYGSSANGFGRDDSDVDLTLVLPDASAKHDVLDLIRRAESLLVEAGMQDVTVRDSARIPVVAFNEPATGLHCDLTVAPPLALKNTALLRTYANANDTLRSLVLGIKEWARLRKLNNAPEHTLSSYGYTLMAIALAISQRPAPWTPCLQALPRSWPRVDAAAEEEPAGCEHEYIAYDGVVHDVYFWQPSRCLAGTSAGQAAIRKSSASSPPLGRAALEFFRHYGVAFAARTNAVSVRPKSESLFDNQATMASGSVDKYEKVLLHGWRDTTRLSIEDPFEPYYDVAHVLRPDTSAATRCAMALTYALLRDVIVAAQESTDDSVRAAIDGILWMPLCAPPVYSISSRVAADEAEPLPATGRVQPDPHVHPAKAADSDVAVEMPGPSDIERMRAWAAAEPFSPAEAVFDASLSMHSGAVDYERSWWSDFGHLEMRTEYAGAFSHPSGSWDVPGNRQYPSYVGTQFMPPAAQDSGHYPAHLRAYASQHASFAPEVAAPRMPTWDAPGYRYPPTSMYAATPSAMAASYAPYGQRHPQMMPHLQASVPRWQTAGAVGDSAGYEAHAAPLSGIRGAPVWHMYPPSRSSPPTGHPSDSAWYQ